MRLKRIKRLPLKKQIVSDVNLQEDTMKTFKRITYILFISIILFSFAPPSSTIGIVHAKRDEKTNVEEASLSVILEIPSYSIEQDEDGNGQFMIDGVYKNSIKNDELVNEIKKKFK